MSLRKVEFIPLGGGSEIGANSYFLRFGNREFILDCGMHPLKTGWEAIPALSAIEARSPDYLLISHAHQDHISSLPYVVKQFPYLRVLMTPQTLQLSRLTLHNSVSILKSQIQPEDHFKVYSHEEIDLLLKMSGEIRYGEKTLLHGYGADEEDIVTATLFDAGHILGSAGILLESGNHSIFYSGDVNFSDQAYHAGALFPNCKVDTIILESTLGASNSQELRAWNDEAAHFSSSANNIFSGGGSILIPVFALGKMQEILSMIWQQMSAGKLANVPLYTGGLGRKISQLYDNYRYTINVKDTGFVLSNIPQNNLYELNDPETLFKEPCIVLASSGMVMPGTKSYQLAEIFLRRNSSAIFTVGYMEESTPGFKIANAQKGDKIRLTEFSELLEVQCTIQKFRFSAHAKREDLLALVDRMQPSRIFLVHGQEESVNSLGAEILKKHPNCKVHKTQNCMPITYNY